MLIHLNCSFSKWNTSFFPPFSKAPGTSISTERMPLLRAQVKAMVPEILPRGRMLALTHQVTLESVFLRDAPASTRSWHTARFRWQAALCSAVSPLNQRWNEKRVGGGSGSRVGAAGREVPLGAFPICGWDHGCRAWPGEVGEGVLKAPWVSHRLTLISDSSLFFKQCWLVK